MEKLNIKQTKQMILYVADKIIENRIILNEVDSQIGDGDHGTGMSLGFSKVKEQLDNRAMKSINEIFQTTGMTMISSMGGASGIIFGSMFQGGVKGLDTLIELGLKDLCKIFTASLDVIKTRGKASIGDKTMIDAFQPAVESICNSAESSTSFLKALQLAEECAKHGVENTKQQTAKFGRAKSLFDRVIGHQDAGATSTWIIFKSMREWLEQNAET